MVGTVFGILLAPARDRELIAKILASEAAVAGVGVAVWVAFRGRTKVTRSNKGDAVEVMATLLRDWVDTQLEKLTDRGRIHVPWHVLAGAKGARSRRSIERHSVAALADVLDVNDGRMVLVGGSDTGKTTMLHLLAEQLFATSGQVPVIVSIASWVPAKSGLFDWIERELHRNHPRLEGVDIVAALRSGRVVSLLDGLDEVESQCHGDARDALRVAAERYPLVVTTRPHGSECFLARGAVVRLDGLPVDEVALYLKADHAQAWRETVAAIRADRTSALAEALSSPLMVWLVCTVYTPRAQRRNVNELTVNPSLGERSAVEEHLLRNLVPEVFRRATFQLTGRRLQHWHAASTWLRFFAMRQRQGDQISFWTLSRMAPTRRIGLVMASAAGVVLGLLATWSPMFVAAIVLAYLLGLPFGFAFIRAYAAGRATGPKDPTRTGFGGSSPGTDGDLYSHFVKFAFGLLLGVVVVAMTVAIDSLTENPGLRHHLEEWRHPVVLPIVTGVTIVVGLAGGVVAAAVLRALPALDSGTGAQADSPVDVVSNDRRSGMAMAVLSWVAVGVLAAATVQFGTGHGAVVGLVAGVGAVPSATSVFNAWVNYKTAHMWLVLRNRLPWQLVDFLDEAHRHGVLRQNGITYEFRHDRLRLALLELCR
jgi:hypothetical protein